MSSRNNRSIRTCNHLKYPRRKKTQFLFGFPCFFVVVVFVCLFFFVVVCFVLFICLFSIIFVLLLPPVRFRIWVVSRASAVVTLSLSVRCRCASHSLCQSKMAQQLYEALAGKTFTLYKLPVNKTISNGCRRFNAYVFDNLNAFLRSKVSQLWKNSCLIVKNLDFPVKWREVKIYPN